VNIHQLISEIKVKEAARIGRPGLAGHGVASACWRVAAVLSVQITPSPVTAASDAATKPDNGVSGRRGINTANPRTASRSGGLKAAGIGYGKPNERNKERTT